jgi:hypothetical protein
MSSVNFAVPTSRSQKPQIIDLNDGFDPDSTSSDDRQLKRSSSYREEAQRPLKRIKIEREVNPEDTINTITNEWLTKHFKRGDILGRSLRDESSMVLAVEDLETKGTLVLKITDSFPPLEVLSKIKAIWEKEESIHLTETVLLGKIQVCSGSYLQLDHNRGEFVVPPRTYQKKVRWAYVYSMPLKAGDLKKIKDEGLSVVEEAAIEVVRVATEAFLNSRGIEPFDMKDINILTRPLTAEDSFRKKHILKYDYLKYTIGSQSYYLPVGKHLITLCDYDKWKPTQVKKDFTGLLEERLKRAPRLLAEIEKFKIPPAPHCRVLSMN